MENRMPSSPGAREALIIERVRSIPEGFVRTYGDIDRRAPGWSAVSWPRRTRNSHGTGWCGLMAPSRWVNVSAGVCAAKASPSGAIGLISPRPGCTNSSPRAGRGCGYRSGPSVNYRPRGVAPGRADRLAILHQLDGEKLSAD